jgi:hypothetical protein
MRGYWGKSIIRNQNILFCKKTVGRGSWEGFQKHEDLKVMKSKPKSWAKV